MKKSTILLVLILGTIVILYFGWPGIRKWWKEGTLKSNTSQSALKPEPPQAQPVEADLPLDSKDATVACGNVLKLDNKEAFVKLDLVRRLARVTHDSGFTDEEIKEMGSEKLGDQAFKAYGFAYLAWDKPFSRTDLDKMVINAADSNVNSAEAKRMSSAERAHLDQLLVKFKRMMLKAFDLGRHDAKSSPCPF